MAQDPAIGREILPIPDVPVRTSPALHASDAEAPPIEPLRPPEGAPNILIVLIDDMGFGASTTFGGPCEMPTFERLAAGGLTYNRFHTTALCSPTRQALLTGRNHHSAEMGSVGEVATSMPGNTSVRPNSVATVAEMLKLNGYNTSAWGKMHQTPAWETSVSGPFDRWPTGDGFEKFWGFVAGETNQWEPTLFEGTTPVEPRATPEEGYHITEEQVDLAVAWMKAQKTMTPDKPFFMYMSYGATHAPHHVPKEWIDKYSGEFDKGWDVVRTETLEKQLAAGIVPEGTELTPRPPGVEAWDDLTDDQRTVGARLMEAYAGFAEHTDVHTGRLIDALEELEILDDTLVIYIAGDNGASAEGGLDGAFNETMALNGVPETVDDILPHLDDIGSPLAFNHYPVGWAHAMNTPYQWTKQVASHFGGTRNGLVMHWPNGIAARGEIRQQFHHVIDVVPTLLEAAGLPQPYMVNGIAQKPIEGVAMTYTFEDADAPERHTTQYFEMFGNRGIYHKGWTAVTKHRTPWEMGAGNVPDLDDDVWELYDTSSDWSQNNDLSAEMPEKLRELQQLFLIEAAKYNVFPIDDRTGERFNATIAGRPELQSGRASMRLGPGMTHLTENTLLNVKNRSHTVSAQFGVPADGADGVIVAQGGRFAGWALYVHEGRLAYCHNWLGGERYYVRAPDALPEGEVTVQYQFDFDGGAPGAGGEGTLLVNGDVVATGRIDKTVPFIFSADETMDIGCDTASPVTDDYGSGPTNVFNGKLEWVQIDLEDDDVSHLEDPEATYHRILARQ
ncbi:MAG: arylsulfatase [Acidimicrobiales bacterium]